MQAPKYIADAKVEGAPIDFPWRGALAHIGPTETVNKMFDLVSSKTTCAVLTEAAGIIGWGAWRLKGRTDVRVLLQMVEASFAFQVHPAYVDPNGADTYEARDRPPAKSAAAQLQIFLWRAINVRWWNSYYQPIPAAFHSAYLVKHILPAAKQRTFATWLARLAKRLDDIAPKPRELPVEDEDRMKKPRREAYWARHRGVALPPEVLDVSTEFDPARREELVDRFLRSVRWQDNPFLRSPTQMKKLGFRGKPYRLG
ncbi:MAG TPA: hypothetical protein VMJ10_34945 [Kofleriaceae bacterium]|nr:hypothetical protein [Kofleriaceae bacterium]